MISGIYQIKNQINGNRYIGSAVNLKRRWQQHLSALRHGKHDNLHLQRAFNKYAESVFVFTILEYIKEPKMLVECEQYYLDTLKPEYNISPTAGSSLGVRFNIETRAKMSAARRGKRDSPETRAKKSAALTGKRSHFYGGHHSAEARAKISASKIGKQRSAETCAKISASKSGERHPMYGKHHSEETKRKISMTRTGKPHPHRAHSCNVETRAKISAALTGKRHPFYGKRHSVETKRKMSVARKAYWQRIRETENR